MMRIRKVHERGFTIVEMMIAMIIMSIVSITLVNFISTWLQQTTLAQNRTALLNNAERALDILNTDVQLSGVVDATNRWSDPSCSGGNQYCWTTGSQPLVMVLAKVATDKSNVALFSDPANYITLKDNEIYYLSGTTLYRRTLDSTNASDAAVTTCPPASATSSCPADTTVATGVSSLTFTYYDVKNNVVTPASARSVQVAITLSTQQGSQTISANYTTRMVFRNE